MGLSIQAIRSNLPPAKVFPPLSKTARVARKTSRESVALISDVMPLADAEALEQPAIQHDTAHPASAGTSALTAMRTTSSAAMLRGQGSEVDVFV